MGGGALPNKRIQPVVLVVTGSGRGAPSAPAHPAPPLTLAGDTRSVRWPEQIGPEHEETMTVLYAVTAILVAASLLASPPRTRRAFIVAARRFGMIAPAFVVMLVLVSVALYFLPDELIFRMLAPEGRWTAMGAALSLGSVSLMPGFIAFPLCGLLLERGAMYMVLSAFSTTLMMVGVVTLPIERRYLGMRLTLVRNAVSLLIAVAVALITGFVFGELL